MCLGNKKRLLKLNKRFVKSNIFEVMTFRNKGISFKIKQMVYKIKYIELTVNKKMLRLKFLWGYRTDRNP